MKKETIIKCCGEADMMELLEDLKEAGYGVMRDLGRGRYTLVITDTPKEGSK